MDIEKLRKVPTDTAHYFIYPTLPQGSSSLNAVCNDIVSYINHLVHLHSYLWHQDPIQLQICQRSDTRTDSTGVWLEGTTCVGDCIDDEWYIVYLLKLVTKKWTDCVVRITDSDGEFLLIEAAEELPKWVTPENATNRVFIHNGFIHLVPLSYTSHSPPLDIQDEEEKMTYLRVEDGVKLVRDPNCNTIASPEIRNAINDRISSYPAMIGTSHLHYSVCHLPKDIARALQVEPQLLSSAVSTFYERDPIQLRACQTMSRFPLDEKYLVRVKMTRPMYAQLQGQRFSAPKIFQKENWFDGVVDEKSVEWRRRDIGLKITCGFEMAWQQGKTESQKSTSTSYLRTFQQKVEQVLQDNTSSLPTVSIDPEKDESPDDWLEIDPQFLESVLSQKDKDASGFSQSEQAQAEKLGGLAEKLQRFVQSEGSLEGALFEDEMSESDSDLEEEPTMTEAEKKKRTEDLVAPVDLSEWGSKTRKKSDKVPKAESGINSKIYDKGESDTNRNKQLQFDQSQNYAAEDDPNSETNDNASEADDDDGSDYMLEDDGIDMEKEAEEFLQFARQELGLSEGEYNEILESKKDKDSTGGHGSRLNALLGLDDTPIMETGDKQPIGSRLDTFEALMNQMDLELEKNISNKQRQEKLHPNTKPFSSTKTTKREGTITPPEEIELTMDAELDRLLERDEDEDNAPMDYTLIKSFLESYKSQAGGPGPASNLAGRLDPSFKWPQDEEQ